MRLIDRFDLTTWSLDFPSSGQSSPDWTQLSFDGIPLCNSMEWVEWQTNPVQVDLCGACGQAGCSVEGFVHVSRLGEHVIWGPPHLQDEDALRGIGPSHGLHRFGSLLVKAETWRTWSNQFQELPDFETLQATLGKDLLQVWLFENLPYKDIEHADDLVSLLHDGLLGCDSMNVEEGIQAVSALIEWLEDSALAQIDGELVPISESGFVAETFYLEGSPTTDLRLVARENNQLSLWFAGNWVLLPAPTRV